MNGPLVLFFGVLGLHIYFALGFGAKHHDVVLASGAQRPLLPVTVHYVELFPESILDGWVEIDVLHAVMVHHGVHHGLGVQELPVDVEVKESSKDQASKLIFPD